MKVVQRTEQEWLAVLENIKGGYVSRGGVEHMYKDSYKRLQLLVEKNVIKSGDRILDIGCANGSLAIALSEMDLEYVGIDCVKEAIDFCNSAFEQYPKFSFVHLDILNPQYNPHGCLLPSPENIVFPEGPFDVVLSCSLYTHLETVPICAQYIAETKRVLNSKGRFYSTWFRSPPHSLDSSASKTVLREADIINLLNDFYINDTFGGWTDSYHDQWQICATKKT